MDLLLHNSKFPITIFPIKWQQIPPNIILFNSPFLLFPTLFIFLLNFILFLDFLCSFIINQTFQPNFVNIYMPSLDIAPSFDQLFDKQF